MGDGRTRKGNGIPARPLPYSLSVRLDTVGIFMVQEAADPTRFLSPCEAGDHLPAHCVKCTKGALDDFTGKPYGTISSFPPFPIKKIGAIQIVKDPGCEHDAYLAPQWALFPGSTYTAHLEDKENTPFYRQTSG